jgi:hypothetical protein
VSRADTPSTPAAAGGGRLPVRGALVRELDLPIPGSGPDADRMPRYYRRRPLKRWRWVGAFGADLMLCAGDARIGPLRQRWWAIARPDGTLLERGSALGSAGVELGRGPEGSLGSLRVTGPDARAQLVIDASDAPEPIEVVSPSGPEGWVWTRKRVGAVARGVVAAAGRGREVELETAIDETAGYHVRRTSWRWSTGVGTSEAGQRVGWNLVTGVHDAPGVSERTVWLDGEPVEVGPVRFADDLSGLEFADGERLAFEPWAERAHTRNLLLVSSRYRQPFGSFSGELPGGVTLAAGYGVTEAHEARW